MEIMKSVPQLNDKNKERVYRVQRGLSVGSEELYQAVLERSEMSSAEAKWITTEHSLLFSSIWRYWLYADSRLLILDSMRYSSLMSMVVFCIGVLPIWVWNSIRRWELFEWVDWRLKSRMIKQIKI